MKTCAVCNKEFPKESFTTKSAKCTGCLKEYKANWYEENKERTLANAKERYKDPEVRARIKEVSKMWVEANREKSNKIKQDWRKRNKGQVNSFTAKRHAAKMSATPSWANQEHIKSYYAFASFLTSATFGGGYHVDHVVPLQGKDVCGLHVENNLQVLRANDNVRKSNKWKCA